MTLFTADCLRLHAGLCEHPADVAATLSSAARVLESQPEREPRELAELYYRIGVNQVAAAKYPAAIANLNMAIVIDNQLTVEGQEIGLEASARRLLAAASLEYGDIAAADRHLFAPACFIRRDSPEWSVLWSRVLLARGDVRLAIEELEQAIEHIGDYPTLAERTASLSLGAALRAAGRFDEARTRLRLTLAWWEASKHEDGFDAPGLGLTLLELGRCERDCGSFQQADVYLRHAQNTLSVRPGERHPYVAQALHERALLAESLDRFGAARHLAEKAVEIQRTCLPARHPDYVASQALSARVSAAAQPVNYAMFA